MEAKFAKYKKLIELQLQELTAEDELGQSSQRTVELDQQSVGRLSRRLKPYHCHKAQKSAPKTATDMKVIFGTITHVRDGDPTEIDGIVIRLAALNCPENDTQKGKCGTKVAKQFTGSEALCELTGAETYDRLVGYVIAYGSYWSVSW